MRETISTIGMSHGQWLAGRRTYIGASDIGAVLGLNQYASAVDVYLDKTGQPHPEDENKYMYFGKKIEGIIADWYAENTGNSVRNDNKIRFHPNFDHIGVNLDRVIYSKDRLGEPGILECKSISTFALKKYQEEGWDYPPSYYAQVQQALAVTNYKWAVIAFLVVDTREFYFEVVEPNQEFIKTIIEHANTFWENNVVKRIPPLPLSGDDVLKLHPYTEDENSSQEVTDSILEKAKEAFDLNRIIKDDTKQLNLLKDEIKVFLNDKAVLRDDGVDLITWRSDKGSMRLNAKELKLHEPDIYDKYYMKSDPVRRFLFKKGLVE